MVPDIYPDCKAYIVRGSKARQKYVIACNAIIVLKARTVPRVASHAQISGNDFVRYSENVLFIYTSKNLRLGR